MGRKPFYADTPEGLALMERRIKDYFDWCDGEPLLDEEGNVRTDKYGVPVMVAHPRTITGLSLALGFNSRDGLIEYAKKRRFADTITRAKAAVEQYAEERLFDRDGAKGAEFTLRCNYGWRDKAKEEQETRTVGVVLLPEILPDGD